MGKNTIKTKDFCYESWDFRDGNNPNYDAPAAARIIGQGHFTQRSHRSTLPVEYPATSVLWKLSLETGEPQWECNVGRNHSYWVDGAAQSLWWYKNGHINPSNVMKSPWMSSKPNSEAYAFLFKVGSSIVFGNAWFHGSDTEAARPEMSVARVTDSGMSHGAITHLSSTLVSPQSKFALSAGSFIHDGKLYLHEDYGYLIVNPHTFEFISSQPRADGHNHLWGNVTRSGSTFVFFGPNRPITIGEDTMQSFQILERDQPITSSWDADDLPIEILDHEQMGRRSPTSPAVASVQRVTTENDPLGHLIMVAADGSDYFTTQLWIGQGDPDFVQHPFQTDVYYSPNPAHYPYDIINKEVSRILRNGSNTLALVRSHTRTITLIDEDPEEGGFDFGGGHRMICDHSSITIGEWHYELYNSSLELLGEYPIEALYPPASSHTDVFTTDAFGNLKQHILPLGDGVSWLILTRKGVWRQSLTGGTIWHHDPGDENYTVSNSEYNAFLGGFIETDGTNVVFSGEWYVQGQPGELTQNNEKTMLHCLDFETGQLKWRRLYPWRMWWNGSNVGLTHNRVMGDIPIIIDGDWVYCVVPNNTSMPVND